jgi:hypothetical protein
MNLVEQLVPGVLGFRWPVADRQAYEYARCFYDLLFNDGMSRKFIEYAFLKAKRKLYDKDENDPTWAAPVLVMQVDSPEEDPAESTIAHTAVYSAQPRFRELGGDDGRDAAGF